MTNETYIENLNGDRICFNGCPYCGGEIKQTHLNIKPWIKTECLNCGEIWRQSSLLWEIMAYLGKSDYIGADLDRFREEFQAEIITKECRNKSNSQFREMKQKLRNYRNKVEEYPEEDPLHDLAKQIVEKTENEILEAM